MSEPSGSVAPRKSIRYVVRGARAAASTALGVATVAAVTAFAPVAANAAGSETGAATSEVRALPGQGVNAGARLAGVQRDLARAVALGQVTPEQARRFEARLSKRLGV